MPSNWLFICAHTRIYNRPDRPIEDFCPINFLYMHKFGEPGSNDFWSSISYQCLPLFHRRMASVRHYLYVRGNLTCLLDSHPCMATNVWNVQSTRTKLIATQIRQRHSRSCPRHQHAYDCSEALYWPRSNVSISRRMQYSHSSGNAHSFAGTQLRM